ncbi:MAG: threonine--tRNA ligase [Holosporales bacterium]|jgi:threonyl-tRNA synthetase|nr:threonine--tRNA ligase [Holosporales bacterium]
MINVRVKGAEPLVIQSTACVSGVEAVKALLEKSQKLEAPAVLCNVNGTTCDLTTLIPDKADVEILTLHSPEALEVIRHSTAHVMAKAVQELYPGTKIAIGPATDTGFFYDFATPQPFSQDDLLKIGIRMKDIATRDLPFERLVVSRKEALELFSKLGEEFKVDIINGLDADEVSLYKLGEMYDLCRGPHLPSTKYICGQGHVLPLKELATGELTDSQTFDDVERAQFALTRVSAVYWKGDASKPSLQRITGVSFASKHELDEYFYRLEEAERRDHRKLGVELDLFHMQDIAPGAVFWHAKGWALYRTIKGFIRDKMQKFGYDEMNTPMIVDKTLWEKSGHWEKFRENMFVTEANDGEQLVLKPMNCPCHVQIFNKKVVSYRDLPWRIAEFGSCHRYEPSGALHGLLRVRGFVQDDAHIFCRPDQIVGETKLFCKLLNEIYSELGFNSYSVKFSDRPAKRAGNDAIWDLAEQALKEAAEAANLSYSLNPGEGAFYGPKLEFVLKDCLGREWQCGTLQVDFVLPERLEARYVTEQGTKEHPVMLHRAVLGSMERFIGILIEHYAGKFPVWLAPVQAVVATITNDADDYAERVVDMLKGGGVRVETDLRREKISYKVREHFSQKIPYIFVVGKQEVENKTVSVRELGSEDTQTKRVDELLGLFRA